MHIHKINDRVSAGFEWFIFGGEWSGCGVKVKKSGKKLGSLCVCAHACASAKQEKWSQSDMEQVTDSEVVPNPLPSCAGGLTNGFDWLKTESVTDSAITYI